MASTPNTDNYTLGKGVVYFDQYDFTGMAYTGERDLGNAPAFTFNIALEKLEHYSSRGGLKAKDKEIISQITPGVTFTLDEVNKENLALLTLGDIEEVSQTGADITDESHVGYPGRRIDLMYRGISAVTVTGAAGTPVYTSPADYFVDTSLMDDTIGRILITEDGDIAADTALEVSYTYATVTYSKISAFANTQIEGRLRFVSDNPAGGQQELEVWRVSLTPSGDTAMIGDDWSTLGFTGEVLKDEANHPDSPYMDIIIS